MTDAPKKPGGRPPRAGAAATDKLQVKCTTEERTRWTEAAKRKGVVLSDVVRAYLDKWAGKP